MKKVLIIVLPLLLIGGGVVGAGLMGVIKIPGLTLAKKPTTLYGEAAKLYGEPKDEVAQAEPEATPKKPKREDKPKTVAEQQIDPEVGAKKLAGVWNIMSPEQLAPIASSYQDNELARVLSQMETEQVARLLALMDPKRAAKLSQELERLGSILPPAQAS